MRFEKKKDSKIWKNSFRNDPPLFDVGKNYWDEKEKLDSDEQFLQKVIPENYSILVHFESLQKTVTE